MGATTMRYRTFGGISLTSADSIRQRSSPSGSLSPRLTVPPAKPLADKIAQFQPYLSIIPAEKLAIDQFNHISLHRLTR